MNVGVESLVEILGGGQLRPLLEAHWREIALYKDRVALDPDWGRYLQLEINGAFLALTVRDGDELVGYAGWIIGPHLHYRSHLVATNDVIFVREGKRASRAGLMLIRESERVLIARGVERILWHIKPHHDWSAVLRHRGYSCEDLLLGKYVGGLHTGEETPSVESVDTATSPH